MAQVSKEIIAKIKDGSDIVKVIGKQLTLHKKGQNHIGVCPFHADKSPSLTVSPSKGIYTCFACGATGDVIKFVQDFERCSFVEALQYLGKDIGVDVKLNVNPEEAAKNKQRESVFAALKESLSKFKTNLSEFPQAKNYLLKDRGISPEMVELYQIGYAQGDNQLARDLPKFYSFDTLLAAGLVGISDEKKFKYDVFRQRIVFPYLDLHGRPIGFTGRILDDSIKTAKYLNTPESLVFNKGSVLFGLYQAKQAIIQQGFVYLTEGQMDVISMAQKNIQNIVAGSGTALTDAQARLLKRFTNTVVLMYDPDGPGVKASLENLKTFLAFGFNVRAITLPEGQDPDGFCRSNPDKDLGILLKNREVDFIDYFYSVKNVQKSSDFENAQLFDLVCESVALVPDKYLRERYMIKLSNVFNTSIDVVKTKVKPSKDIKIQAWKPGFYGLDEAQELMEKLDTKECYLVFSQEEFINSFSENPTILSVGSPTLADIHSLRQITSKVEVVYSKVLLPNNMVESEAMELLISMHKNGIEITIIKDDDPYNFVDFYVNLYGDLLSDSPDYADDRITDSAKRAEAIGRCADVISHLEATTRAVMIDVYIKKLGMKSSAFDKVLKPFLAKKKDRAMIDNQRLNELTNAFLVDPEVVPDYVEKNPALWSTYLKWGFYPLSDKDGRYFSYMFKNQNGNSHASVSDFYMKPLLHIYDESNDNSNNKRVIQLCHMDKRLDKYVEWKSNIFSNLPKVHEQLVNAGPYNYFGSVEQYKRIWMNMSYEFTMCYPTTMLGQHPEGFFVFGNAIFHKVEGQYQIDYVDDLGVVAHENTNYYLPAFSKIHLDKRNDNDKNRYKLARNLMYKEIPAKNQITFDKWAALMNDVYKVNDNGKWAILYAITCAFRDFIFDHRGEFTAPFFIGPTSSGKSMIAESIRNLYMDHRSASFNLNTGTPAAFFMFVESLRNIPIIMEEYNDNDINPIIFQALKAATLDGQGRIKVADVASKTMDSSDINAPLILLGQEAPQKDDGSLANRCILCDVPSRDFSEEEKEIYEELKSYERTGLTNILLDILQLRDIYEKHYLAILIEEGKKLKDSIKLNVTNTEGLIRIVNAISLMTSTLRLIEEHAKHIKLPFTYEEFSPIAEQKALKQVERISTTNKLSTYFQTISTLITHDRIKIGREIKMAMTDQITRILSGKKKEEITLPKTTNILYIDFESVYSLYQKELGSNEALSRQSLTAYFNSNQAFYGRTNATRFTWSQAEHVAADMEGYLDNEGNNIQTAVNARMRMVKKTKVTSAYMFDYDILKELVDIDFDRMSEEDEETNFINESGEKLPPSNESTPF